MQTEHIRPEPLSNVGQHFVAVSIATTSGFFPPEGLNRVPSNQKIHIELDKAAHALKIKDTSGWVATIVGPEGKRTLNVAESYAENGLACIVEIDWGPCEGGGG